jgi:hypothetical protein
MDLNYLLSTRGIDAKKSHVLVMRHTPTEPELRKVFPWLAAEKPALFNAYQQLQGPDVERKLKQANYLASFTVHGCRTVFVGLYEVSGYQPISYGKFWSIPENRQLQKLGMIGWAGNRRQGSRAWFKLKLTDVLADWKGKLIIHWPPPLISWTRWAHDNRFGITAVLEESVLDKGLPRWDELRFTWEQLRHLPKSWTDILSQWRVIYYIFDTGACKGYVGAAYGNKNLFGRWLNYRASGHGGNKLLRKCDPKNLQFTILERVSPDMDAHEVIRIEGTWKDRLHSRAPCGLNDN